LRRRRKLLKEEETGIKLEIIKDKIQGDTLVGDMKLNDPRFVGVLGGVT